MSDNSSAVVAFLAAAIMFGFFFPHKGETKDKTIYLTSCMDGKHSTDDCPKGLLIFDSKHFRVFPEQKTITEQNGLVFLRYENCTILDAENWECSLEHEIFDELPFSSDHGTIKLIDGTYFNSTDQYASEGIHAPKAGEQPFWPTVEQHSQIIWSVEKELYYRQK